LQEENKGNIARMHPYIQLINKMTKNNFSITKKDSRYIIKYIRQNLPELEKSPEHTLMTAFGKETIKYLEELFE